MKTLLLLCQVYVPDPASVGQHMHDAAAELVRRGFRVVVLTADRGYDDPNVKYPSREVRDGVEIRRLPFSSFGKRSMGLRLLGGFSFLFQCVVRGLFTRGLCAVLVTTVPPMAAAAALTITLVRQVPLKYWVMDLNPDQMVELGKLAPGSLSVRAFDCFNRIVLRNAADVIALDRFMAARLLKKRDVSSKLSILPPWPHEEHLEAIDHSHNPFRREHGLDGKFVIMYSGNHGFSTPVRTVLDAALRLAHRDDLVFMFIGGGVGKAEVDALIAARKPQNLRSLPYQPLDQIKYSLSAADVHLVSVGNDVVGVVHPCKGYGAMAVSRPILLLGPAICHVSDLVAKHDIGWHIAHGEVERAVRTIEEIAATPPGQLEAMGARAKAVIDGELRGEKLLRQFCDVVVKDLGAA